MAVGVAEVCWAVREAAAAAGVGAAAAAGVGAAAVGERRVWREEFGGVFPAVVLTSLRGPGRAGLGWAETELRSDVGFVGCIGF
jgi:hypothetical protein